MPNSTPNPPSSLARIGKGEEDGVGSKRYYHGILLHWTGSFQAWRVSVMENCKFCQDPAPALQPDMTEILLKQEGHSGPKSLT